MRKFTEYVFLWTVGGILYYAIEMIYRGHSHWTMFFLGGICLLFFAIQQKAVEWKDSLWKQAGRCTLFVTCSEFTTGIVVNKWLKWDVWDYSDQPFQLFGQICPLFIFFFSILSIIGIIFSGYLMHWVFGESKPKYKLF